MTFPTLTAFYGSILGLIYVALSAWVVAGRLTGDVLHGDGGDSRLLKRIRAHGNFAEYVPFALLLVALYEASGGGAATVRVLLIVLIVARLAHPVGMFAPKNSPQQFACRGGGIIATFVVLAAAAILLLAQTA